MNSFRYFQFLSLKTYESLIKFLICGASGISGFGIDITFSDSSMSEKSEFSSKNAFTASIGLTVFSLPETVRAENSSVRNPPCWAHSCWGFPWSSEALLHKVNTVFLGF
ncbi:hypothetical protein AYI69_g1552 [Smittium culicis]|uniref:Uncharacterized protein n=1 Tax=Smittium culicis TaxID=133412 RepID=A0A1R1YPX6_9FUNG|nr:hypothetical protein AYI69_g1552 [Smittium culicis]